MVLVGLFVLGEKLMARGIRILSLVMFLLPVLVPVQRAAAQNTNSFVQYLIVID
jgi:hypothetical protein